MAASQGCTQPISANGVISRCQTSDPYRFCRALRRACCNSASSAASGMLGCAASAECADAIAVGTAIDIAQGQLMTSSATITGRLCAGSI
ncbi:hypothetical protein D3C86_1763090 [compost metagenome]